MSIHHIANKMLTTKPPFKGKINAALLGEIRNIAG
jgi:hypothetical protein